MNRPFPHSTSVHTNNSTRARLGGGTFSYIYCIFVHPNLDSVPLFVGMQERSIEDFSWRTRVEPCILGEGIHGYVCNRISLCGCNKLSCINRPFSSSLMPLFQNESKCETFHMKMSSACSFIFMQSKSFS